MDVFVVYAAQAVDAARDATRTIPIIVPTVGDMLGGGYVASFGATGRQYHWNNSRRNWAEYEAATTAKGAAT
jgi:ABC-type uncharacterized transport system substrate-binding protein